MNQFKRIVVLLFCLAGMSVASIANDAIYYTSGNFLVPLKETNVSVKKEVLTITICKDGYASVDVDYTFYNDSDAKTVTMAFEAESSYGVCNPLNRKGEHPNISDFTVTMNGELLPYHNAVVAMEYADGKLVSDLIPLDLKQWQGYGEAPDTILPTDDGIYNPTLDSCVSFAYAYYFEAPFLKGENKVHHTYRYRMGESVYSPFEVAYWLEPATRWANGQIDDFTLRVNAENIGTIVVMDDSLFKQSPFVLKDTFEDGTTVDFPVYHFKKKGGKGSAIFATICPTMLEWHSTNFRPKGSMLIESGEIYVSGDDAMMNLDPQGYLVVENNGDVCRYIADTDDGYFVVAQDYGYVSRDSAHLEFRRAEDEQGSVQLKYEISAGNVHVKPDIKSRVVTVIKEEEGACRDDGYKCLGYIAPKSPDYRGWYKIKANGKVGYISSRIVNWDVY